MKKTLIYALVAVLMVAFASCGNKETKQFKSQKDTIKGVETLIDKAETCEDLSFAAFGFLALAFDDTEYAEDEKMTPEEEKTIEKMVEDLTAKMEKKSEEMDCGNQPEDDSDEYDGFFDDLFEDDEAAE